jgi:deaminated glutathione amidase
MEGCGRDSKRFCSHAELGGWYTPGMEPIVFEINGVRFGCAICLELRAITAQAHAANNSHWVSLVTPSSPFQGPVTQFIDPLGNPIAKAARHRGGLAVGQIDIGAGSLWQKIDFGRAWREAARAGEIYRERHADTPRSRSRQTF